MIVHALSKLASCGFCAGNDLTLNSVSVTSTQVLIAPLMICSIVLIRHSSQQLDDAWIPPICYAFVFAFDFAFGRLAVRPDMLHETTTKQPKTKTKACYGPPSSTRLTSGNRRRLTPTRAPSARVNTASPSPAPSIR